MKAIQNPLLTKGIFAVAVVAVAGIVGAVNYTQAAHADKPTKEQCAAAGYKNYGQCVRVWAQDDGGYGNLRNDTLAAAAEFRESIQNDTDRFTQSVDALSATASGQLGVNGQKSTKAFSDRFTASTATYNQTVDTAFETFLASVEEAADTSSSRNEFIDQFNRAKATYLNSLDAAKNRYASELSNMGHNANVVKDQFMNGFNSSRDAYSNRLEVAKNEFADTVQ